MVIIRRIVTIYWQTIKTYKCYNKAGTVYIFYITVQSKLGSSCAMLVSDVWIEKLAILSHEDTICSIGLLSSEDVAVVVDSHWFTDCHLEATFNMNTSRVRLRSSIAVDGRRKRYSSDHRRFSLNPVHRDTLPHCHSLLSDLTIRLYTTSLNSVSQQRWLYHQMFKQSSDQFNSLDTNHVTSHSSFSLVNRLQLTHTVTTTISM